MIRHCSLFKFKDSTSAELLDEIVDRFRVVVAAVPSVRSAVVGPNVGFHEGNYDLAATVEFDSLDGYREYCEDATHLAFVHELLLPNLRERVAVQFDLDAARAAG
jgi:hypothetical protein